MRKAWFCWELASREPVPVIFYDNLSNQKNPLNPRILQSHELGENWERTGDDEIKASFKLLKEVFPYVAPPEND